MSKCIFKLHDQMVNRELKITLRYEWKKLLYVAPDVVPVVSVIPAGVAGRPDCHCNLYWSGHQSRGELVHRPALMFLLWIAAHRCGVPALRPAANHRPRLLPVPQGT